MNETGIVCIQGKKETGYFVRAVLKRGIVSMSTKTEDGIIYLFSEGVSALLKAEEIENALREINGAKRNGGGAERFYFLKSHFDNFDREFFGAKEYASLIEELAK